ncbi:hypothetical protein [Actinomadura flavalba]|uniref:hypothetical protein n=1 Tax=Actinomadura flavalba TaxID=1120938 RepID=UPI00036098F7|nr:hypothetical protein [Actinomadura flavalba]
MTDKTDANDDRPHPRTLLREALDRHDEMTRRLREGGLSHSDGWTATGWTAAATLDRVRMMRPQILADPDPKLRQAASLHDDVARSYADVAARALTGATPVDMAAWITAMVTDLAQHASPQETMRMLDLFVYHLDRGGGEQRPRRDPL